MLAAALRRLDECGDATKKVYALEKPGSKGRGYHIMSPDKAWQMTKSNSDSAHYYEVLSGPCNLYLDIEWLQCAPSADETDKVNAIVQHVLTALEQTYQQTKHHVSVCLASASGRVKGGYKCSWHAHFHCSGICWANALAVGQFVRATCKGVPEVDKIPYAGQGQNWRCVGSSKATDPSRKFVPLTRRTFMGCTVQHPVGGRKMVYPAVELLPKIDVPVPPHVLELALSLNAGGTPTMCGDSRCVVPFTELQVCEHVNRKHKSNHQYAVINTMTLMWKMNCHSCTDCISVWRTFDASVLKRAFHKQVESYHANVNRPPARVEWSGPVVLNLGGHGPPPAVKGRAVQCSDGVYICENIKDNV